MYVSIPILVLVACALWWALVAVCRTSSSASKRVCQTVTPWVLWIAIIVVPVVVMVGIWDHVAGSVRV